MIKVNYKDLIQESVEELRDCLKSLDKPKAIERCEVLIWLKSGQVTTMKEAMELKNRSTNHGSTIWKLYKNKGLKEYLRLGYKARKSPLSDKEELEKHLSTEGFSTINEARAWILKTYNIEYTENGLGNYFRNKKIKLKTGRPHHPKRDDEKREVYKKNMRRS